VAGMLERRIEETMTPPKARPVPSSLVRILASKAAAGRPVATSRRSAGSLAATHDIVSRHWRGVVLPLVELGAVGWSCN
jgi:hypothetical protein